MPTLTERISESFQQFGNSSRKTSPDGQEMSAFVVDGGKLLPIGWEKVVVEEDGGLSLTIMIDGENCMSFKILYVGSSVMHFWRPGMTYPRDKKTVPRFSATSGVDDQGIFRLDFKNGSSLLLNVRGDTLEWGSGDERMKIFSLYNFYKGKNYD